MDDLTTAFLRHAWQETVKHIRPLTDVEEVRQKWQSFADLLEKYRKEAQDRADLHQ